MPWTWAISLFLCLRFAWSAAAAWMSPYLKLDPALIALNHFIDSLMDRSAGWSYRLLGVWERFDTLWYSHIAASGYDVPNAVVFYPLYPLLIKAANLVIGNALVSALLVASASTAVLLFGLVRLLSLDQPPAAVRRALVLYGCWPTAFIFFAGYAESTLLAFVVWSLYSARRERWALAGALGLLAGLTKAAGAIVILPLILIAWERKGRVGAPPSFEQHAESQAPERVRLARVNQTPKGRGGGPPSFEEHAESEAPERVRLARVTQTRQGRWRAWPLCLAALGPIIFLLFLRSGGRLLPSEAYPLYWKTAVDWPWNTLADICRLIVAQRDLKVGLNFALFSLTFFFALSRKQRPEYLAYTLALLLLFLTKRSDASQQQWARYALLVFPACAQAAAAITDKAVFAAVIAVFGLTNLYLLRAFLEWSLVV